MSEDEVVRPEFEVWNHLSSGWDLAHQDIADKLHPDDLEFYTRAADVIVGALSEGMVGPHLEAVREKLTAMVPGLAPTRSARFSPRFCNGMPRMRILSSGTQLSFA